MFTSHIRSPCFLLYCLLLCISTVNALHFYLDANEKRCFIEELPSDTVVEGHYRALEWNEHEQSYKTNEELGILVQVTEVESGHSVASTRGPPDGRFTFTSHDAGDHSICLSTNYSSSWFGPVAHIRLYLDLVVGSTKPNLDHDRSHVSVLASRIRDLNIKIEDIRREQQYQREREADFRDLSEVTNSRAVWYSVVQIGVLITTCTWQLRHLRRFFEDRKIR
ncbi:emp24/gp25L/p24 family/GOLD-domain-containing protein [Russula brevipes]|nr:emp24/gp25L/p24 family/GOLD-domain-containing protein [Russula brevipes]